MQLDPESIAQEFLRRVRLDTGDVIEPAVLAGAHGLVLIQNAPRGCGGMLATPFLYSDGRRNTIVHELAHHAVALARLPAQDEYFIAAVAARLLTPTYAFKRALRWGADHARLSREFGVSETCVALREGETTGRPIAVVTRSHVFARGDWEWPAADVLRRMVRQRAKWLQVEQLGDDRRRLLVRAA